MHTLLLKECFGRIWILFIIVRGKAFRLKLAIIWIDVGLLRKVMD